MKPRNRNDKPALSRNDKPAQSRNDKPAQGRNDKPAQSRNDSGRQGEERSNSAGRGRGRGGPPRGGKGRKPAPGRSRNARGGRGRGRDGQERESANGSSRGSSAPARGGEGRREGGGRRWGSGRRDGGQRGSRPQRGGREGGRGSSQPTGPPQDVLGVLEVLEQGYGFLRRAENNYQPGDGDVYVPTDMIRKLDLEEGLQIKGVAQATRGGNGSISLVEVKDVNGGTADAARDRLPFGKVISLDPLDRIRLETTKEEVSMRALDLITPIGKGQRGLIVAPPKTGKTTLLKQVANAVATNHPEMELVVLLIDERPEEVTDFRRSVRGEVIASSSDELARNHVSVAEIVIEKAKRTVEFGRDTVILLDSLTRLSRAYNVEQRGSGKILSGGIDARTMERPKKFFGAARNAEQGGSLTIIATALIDTGSRMDEVIFQEFKGTGNMELQLDRRLFDRRIFPCVDVNLSGTRKEEKLLPEPDLVKIQKLRRALSGMDAVQAMEKLVQMLQRTGSNAEFLEAIT